MPKTENGPCNPACTKVIELAVDKKLAANQGKSAGGRTNIDGYRYLNVLVAFEQQSKPSAPVNGVNLGVVFYMDSKTKVGARSYVNLEANLPGPQAVSFIEVSPGSSVQTSQGTSSINSYLARVPVMAPFVQLSVYNWAPIDRTVTVIAYLVS